jgi:phage terminase large subunit-like protein
VEAAEIDVRHKAAEILLRAQAARPGGPWRPLPHQAPPPGNWYGWLLLAGRGAGKTDACAQYVVDHVNGPACMPGPIPHWIGIIAPTLGDAATACFSGPSGIQPHDATARMTGGPGGLAIKWPNGSEAKLFGAHTPDEKERLRAGGNRCLFWLEELAAWRYLDDCWDQMRFGLRSGPRPHWIGSTTPKPRTLIKKMATGGVKNVEITRATTYDNPYLPAHIREAFEDTYGGTTLGAQELYGQIVDQDENALWRRENIDEYRVSDAPDLLHISVGVDPSGGAGEQGIVVVGKEELWTPGARGTRRRETHGYVLADATCRLAPEGWGRRAVQAAVDNDADDIIVEKNFGGDMALAVVQGAADAEGVSIPVRTVTASRGKRVRAEPVSAMSARGRWHHVGRFDELEDQLCTWTPEMDYSPDRLDAMVWPPWYMRMVRTTQLQAVGTYSGAAMAQKIG